MGLVLPARILLFLNNSNTAPPTKIRLASGSFLGPVHSGGTRPGRARSNDLAERLPPWLSFFSFKRNICVYRRGKHINERRSFCQFADSENVKSITSLDPCHTFITVSVTKIVIKLLTDVICMFAFNVQPALHFRQ